MNIFYQLIGFGALIAMGLSYWQNDKRTILLWQVVANLIFAIHYTLLHAYSGALCSFFQIVVLLLFLLQEKFNWSKLVTAIPIVAVFLLIAVVTYETPVTVLPIVASLAALPPRTQKVISKWENFLCSCSAKIRSKPISPALSVRYNSFLPFSRSAQSFS